VPNFTFITAEMWEYSPKIVNISNFDHKFDPRGDAFALFLRNCQRLYASIGSFYVFSLVDYGKNKWQRSYKDFLTMRAFTHKFSVAPAKLLIGSKKSYSVTPHPCIVKRQLLASHDDIGTLRDFRAVDPDDFAAIYGPGPPGIPVREFPGIWHCQICGGNSREFYDNCDRLFISCYFTICPVSL